MRVVQVAPTPFGASGIFGGGERYPLELARALARRVECELVTFGASAVFREPGGLSVRVLNPVTRLGHPAPTLSRASNRVRRRGTISPGPPPS